MNYKVLKHCRMCEETMQLYGCDCCQYEEYRCKCGYFEPVEENKEKEGGALPRR